MNVKRGDVWFADLRVSVGSEQSGIRPVLIVQNNTGNKFAPTVIVVPMTSKHKKHLPTHVNIQGGDGVKQDSVLLAEQVSTISKERLMKRIGSVSGDVLCQVKQALLVSMQLN